MADTAPVPNLTPDPIPWAIKARTWHFWLTALVDMLTVAQLAIPATATSHIVIAAMLQLLSRYGYNAAFEDQRGRRYWSDEERVSRGLPPRAATIRSPSGVFAAVEPVVTPPPSMAEPTMPGRRRPQGGPYEK
jgi:hypothetical protein